MAGAIDKKINEDVSVSDHDEVDVRKSVDFRSNIIGNNLDK